LSEGNFFQDQALFKPEILFWNWGYEWTTRGIRGPWLTEDFHISLAKELKSSADQILKGSLIVVQCGGSRRDFLLLDSENHQPLLGEGYGYS